MRENIFAYTANGADAPEFVSVNKTDAGGAELIVRSPKDIGGATAQVNLSHENACRLYYALQTHLFDDERPEPTHLIPHH